MVGEIANKGFQMNNKQCWNGQCFIDITILWDTVYLKKEVFISMFYFYKWKKEIFFFKWQILNGCPDGLDKVRWKEKLKSGGSDTSDSVITKCRWNWTDGWGDVKWEVLRSWEISSIYFLFLIFIMCCFLPSVQFSSVQSLSHVRLFATLWIAACQASLSITNSRS